MWQWSGPGLKCELLVEINWEAGKSEGKKLRMKMKIIQVALIFFYSDVYESSNNIWSPVVLEQSRRHLGVLDNKVKISK